MPTTASATRPPLPLLAASIVARLPVAMLTIGVLVHVEALTGSFAAAGLASGALALAQGACGPALGRVVDARGQTRVLLGAAVLASASLVALGTAPEEAPLPVLLVLAALLGAGTPPVAACLRTLLPELVRDPDALRRTYAADSTLVELTWVSGPPLVLATGAAAGSGAALILTGVVLGLATAAFAAAPASRRWRPPARRDGGPSGSALRAPGVRLLVVVLLGAGLVFGATEVAATAAADALGRTSAAGPLLGLWGLGGLVGGLVATRTGAGARSGRGLVALLGGLALLHAIPAAATGSLPLLGLTLGLAGTTIAPLCASAYALVDDAARPGTLTESFAWLATAVALGSAGGAATAGVLADLAGPAAAFTAAGVLGALTAAAASSLAGALPAAAPHPATA